MKIPFIDLKARYIEEKKELLTAVEKVLSSGSLVMTKELQEFEEKVEQYTKAKFCIGLNSGTDALMMGLWAAGIKKDDEVIQPAISFIATVGATIHIGAIPIFCDVNNDGLIDVSKIESKITKKTKAIVPVHWAGKMCEMDKIEEIAKKYNLKIIEDSAQAMGSYFKKKHGGLFGECGAISCHPLKNLNAVGDGGLLLTNNETIADKVKLYRNHGLLSRDNVVSFGINSRLDVIHAEILKFRLKKLNDVINRRRKNANFYREFIKCKGEIYIPPEKSNEGYVDSYVMFIVQADERDKLKEFLDKNGIETLIYYGTPLHLHTASRKLGYKEGDFPVAESQCKKVLALPHNQNISQKEVAFVASKINEFYGH
ncbi:DegT/DnrJ/EryC1/StrS family aminotransferase [Alphaproteobacteria bacterium]|nr:DegT/DnrJ/EryC1/StrS family aminotransferase [Alphaproteobacteria bacterium]